MRITIVAAMIATFALASALGTTPALACSGWCRTNPFGCVNPGEECFDLLTGCGTCWNASLWGPCVCDPSGGQPGEYLMTAPSATGTEFGMEFGKKKGSDRIPLGGGLPVPQPGDVLCGTQLDTAAAIHVYGLGWGLSDPDVVDVEGTKFCVTMREPMEGEPDWLEFEFTGFKGFIPSFRPNALPAFKTGDNHIVLDRLPSRGKYHLPTGTVVAEVHAKLVNDLFRFEYPIPMRAGMRARLDLAAGRLRIERAHVVASTPSDYRGPVP